MEPTEIMPQAGGSYLRNPDGSLTKNTEAAIPEQTAQIAPQPDPAAITQE